MSIPHRLCQQRGRGHFPYQATDTRERDTLRHNLDLYKHPAAPFIC